MTTILLAGPGEGAMGLMDSMTENQRKLSTKFFFVWRIAAEQWKWCMLSFWKAIYLDLGTISKQIFSDSLCANRWWNSALSSHDSSNNWPLQTKALNLLSVCMLESILKSHCHSDCHYRRYLWSRLLRLAGDSVSPLTFLPFTTQQKATKNLKIVLFLITYCD